MNQQRMDSTSHQVSRRELLIGGSLALGALAISGCSANKSTASNSSALTAKEPIGRAPPVDLGPPPGVIPRSQWTYAGISSRIPINPMNGVNRITVHHDGMPPVSLQSTSQVSTRLESIRRAHLNRYPEPFADIGYHYIIDPQGHVWEGRSTRYQGAHVKENNEHNLGIMVLGNFNEQHPTPQALASVDRFVAHEMSRYNVPLARIYTHQELRQTECPGRNLQAYMRQTRSRGGALAMAAAANRYS